MKTCLVVDDSSVVRKIARRILEGLQFEVTEAEDGSKRSKVYITVGSMTGEFMYRKADGSDTPERSGDDAPAAPTTTEANQTTKPSAQDDDIPF